MKTVRKFSQRPIVMLTAGETLCNNFIDNETFLASRRPSWLPPFFTNLKTEVQAGFPLIGIDNRKVTREATLALHLIIEPAVTDLIELKVQMDVDIPKERRAELYTILGIMQYYKTAVNSNQIDLINLLAKLKTNITPELIVEITGKGIDAALLTRLAGYALTLQNANVTQDTAKITQPELTAAVVEQLNAIYTKVVNICKISRTFYKKDPEKKKLFSYAKAVATVTGGTPEPEPETETSPSPVPQPN